MGDMEVSLWTSGIFVHKVSQCTSHLPLYILHFPVMQIHKVILPLVLHFTMISIHFPSHFIYLDILLFFWTSTVLSTYSCLPSLCLFPISFPPSCPSPLSTIAITPPLSPSSFSLVFLPHFSSLLFSYSHFLQLAKPDSFYDLAELEEALQLLWSLCWPWGSGATVHIEEVVSIFGEMSLVLCMVDQNTWVVYITVVPLGTLEKWEL